MRNVFRRNREASPCYITWGNPLKIAAAGEASSLYLLVCVKILAPTSIFTSLPRLLLATHHQPLHPPVSFLLLTGSDSLYSLFFCCLLCLFFLCSLTVSLALPLGFDTCSYGSCAAFRAKNKYCDRLVASTSLIRLKQRGNTWFNSKHLQPTQARRLSHMCTVIRQRRTNAYARRDYHTIAGTYPPGCNHDGVARVDGTTEPVRRHTLR